MCSPTARRQRGYDDELCQPSTLPTLYELTSLAAYWTWDCAGSEPRIVRSNGTYGNGYWPAYSLGDLWRMSPRATTWFKEETPRLGGMCSARTDRLPHYAARSDSPEDTAATLQIAFEQSRHRQHPSANPSISKPKQREVI